MYAFDTTDEESDTDESEDMSDQDKALFKECLNALIEADNAAEDVYIGDISDCYYFRLPADSHAAIDMGEQEETLVKHAVISGTTSARIGMENCLSYFGENTTTPSMQPRLDSEAREESVLIPESTQASDDGALLHLSEQPTTPSAQAMLGATAVECIPIYAIVSYNTKGQCTWISLSY